ncbi:GNAT family N-acetyltransferase [Amycolatopsis nivea]|uniref:GNAT family N-acetyltransferase n=1 Tax=Amycolatopsis nivea TaxID=1644109 RepID=UPI00106F7EC3|nr:GNAT family N-acetyltransferase [Amycolatopsis nivea]
MESVPLTEIRPARDDELAAVAALRWRWVADQSGPLPRDQDDFVREFAAWARAHAETHRCLVAVRDEHVLGMAFLALTPRVPTPQDFSRICGDVQCVYVVPEARDSGVGGLLIEATLRLAAEFGLERVTVHSSDRAIAAYLRHGFSVSKNLLQAELRIAVDVPANRAYS